MYPAKFLAAGAVRYTKSCVKNCVKVLVGRKPYFSHQDVFFRLYLRQLVGGCPIRKITCAGFPGEGAGSQALMIIRAMNFAHAFGLTYLHTPFAEIAHADRPMAEWVEAWESHFNLGVGEQAAASGEREVVNFAHNFTDLTRCFGFEETLGREVLSKVREKYYANKSPRVNEVLTVGVHVRRGDVTAGHQDMWTETAAVAKTIEAVRSVVESLHVEYKIQIFSNGMAADFAELEAPDAELSLNADPVWTMRELIEADVLVMAKSTFSYVAALISDSVKIYEPCGYEALDGWIACGPDGSFDSQALERQLRLVIRSNPERSAQVPSVA